MTPLEASKEVGCAVTTIRDLIRAGTIKADKKLIPGGFVYVISKREVTKFKNKKRDPRGRKRGSDAQNS